MTTRNDIAYDVAIVGYGPTGATLANLLGQAGLRVLVLEREAAAYHLPRAVHFDAEVMRVFQAIGLADEVERGVGQRDILFEHRGMAAPLRDAMPQHEG